MDEKRIPETMVLMVAIILVGGVSFGHYSGVGFTNNDDIRYALNVGLGKNPFDVGWAVAKEQGRWHYLLSFITSYIPYIVDSFLYYKIITYLCLSLDATVLFFFARRIFKSNEIGFLSVLCFLVFLQNDVDHSLVTSYFAGFHLAIASIMGSFIVLMKYLEGGRPRHLMISVALYGWTLLMYEFIALYSGLFILYIILSKPTDAPILKYKIITPYIVVVIFYFVITLIFRQFYQSTYPGNTIRFEGITVGELLWIPIRLSLSAVPSVIFFDSKYATLFNYYSDNPTGHSSSLLDIFQNIKLLWAIKFIIVVLVVYWIIRNLERGLTTKHFLYLLITSVLLLFIPNVLQAATVKFQDSVLKGYSISYSMTYFSFFGFIIFFISVSLYSRALFKTSLLGLEIYAISVAVVVGAIGILVDYSNHYISKYQVHSFYKWKTLDRVMKTTSFQQIPDGSAIYAPSLWRGPFTVYYGIGVYDVGYWDGYVKAKSGKNVKIVKDIKDARGKNYYFMNYVQAPVADDQYIVLGRVKGGSINNNDATFYSDTVEVFNYSVDNHIGTVYIRLKNEASEIYTTNSIIEVNGNNASFAYADERNTDLMEIKIWGAEIDLSSVALSNYLTTKTIPTSEISTIHPVNINIEAEGGRVGSIRVTDDGKIVSGKIIDDEKASGGRYFINGDIKYRFMVEVEGQYRLKVKVKAPDMFSDSFILCANDSDCQIWHLSHCISWEWKTSPIIWHLREGLNTVELRFREPTAIDQLMLVRQ